nr:hypothetical protein RAR13_09410 [Aminobacter aminovorans]
MSLTSNDGKTIVAMAGRGDKHHDIAAYFGENQARVAEVLSGQMFGPLQPAPVNGLPPKGSPGLKARKLVAFIEKALEALENNDPAMAKTALENGLKRWNLHE